MDDNTKTFDRAMQTALTNAAASAEQSTQGTNTSEQAEHYRAFLRTFERWDVLFRRRDSDVESDQLLIAEYYDSLGHLSEEGFKRLTSALKETQTFFPTIRECLDAMKCDRYDWAHPFRSLHTPGTNPLLRAPDPVRRLAAPVHQIDHAL